MSNDPSPSTVVISSSCTSSSYHNHLPNYMKRTFNEELPVGSRGLYIGGSDTDGYTIWYKQRKNNGEIICRPHLVGGITHPIANIQEIVNTDAYVTNAPNIEVDY